MACSSKKNLLLLEFIETYRSLPELWDTQCSAYSNRVKKAAAYDKLIEKLKPVDGCATRESVVKKINKLRSTFRKELKKISNSKKSGTSADEVYTPSLWYSDDLMFLVDQETPAPGESTLSEEGDNCVSESSSSVDDFFATPAKRSKTKSNSINRDLAQQFLAKASKYLETEDDECSTLAKGYATKLRKLTQQQLMLADKAINEALLDAQMGILTRGSYLVHPVPALDTPQQSPYGTSSISTQSSSSENNNAKNWLETFFYEDL